MENTSSVEDWPVNSIAFQAVDESLFMDEVRKYQVIYDSKSKLYKNKSTTKLNAWREIAKTFKATTKDCETR